MGISQDQLERWAKYQQLDILSKTYNDVSSILQGIKLPKGVIMADPYLQGSYANATNTYTKGDIDIVVELTSCVYTQPKEKSSGIECSFGMTEWRDLLEEYLKKEYKEELIDSSGSKTIKIKENQTHKPVDIVPALRYYYYPEADLTKNALQGIGIYDQKEKQVIYNFPKIHKRNSQRKHENTNDLYKKYVRIFKNIRKQLSDKESNFPSYFIEAMIYNVPDDKFMNNYQEGFLKILIFLLESIKNDTYQNFMCPNEIDMLFGDKSTQWNDRDFRSFLINIIKLDENWK